MFYLNFCLFNKMKLMSLHRGKCFSVSVTVKMGNAKNEFERYNGLGDSEKWIENKFFSGNS